MELNFFIFIYSFDHATLPRSIVAVDQATIPWTFGSETQVLASKPVYAGLTSRAPVKIGHLKLKFQFLGEPDEFLAQSRQKRVRFVAFLHEPPRKTSKIRMKAKYYLKNDSNHKFCKYCAMDLLNLSSRKQRSKERSSLDLTIDRGNTMKLGSKQKLSELMDIARKIG